jgi:hypothetical protein
MTRKNGKGSSLAKSESGPLETHVGNELSLVSRTRKEPPPEHVNVPNDPSFRVDKCSEEYGESVNTRRMILSPTLVRSPDPDIFQSLDEWKRHTHALVHSKEMSAFLLSSRAVVMHSTGMALHIACLPVTVPLNILSNATDLVVGTCSHVVTSTFVTIMDHTVLQPVGEDATLSLSLIDGLFHHVTHAVPMALHVVGQVKDNLGGTILSLVAPVIGGSNDDAKEQRQDRNESAASRSFPEYINYLDRLRLDYPESVEEAPSEKDDDAAEEQEQPHISPSDTTKYLLRVGDLGISLESDQCKTVLYIDLSEEFASSELTKLALENMTSIGLSLVNTCVHTAIYGAEEPPFSVQWNPEGSTNKILRRQRTSSWLEKETLIWSGKFTSSRAFQPDIPLFLARGIVPGSPATFLDLLWDNARTNEYNRFCLGRIDQLIIDHGVDGTPIRGAKVVKSETKVPFTGMSVVLTTLMVVRPLDDGAFLIVSRSLNSGRAGYHTSTRHVQEGGKSELLWGVNLLRPVSGKPSMTDLTCVSHIKSSLVPHFLASRVGMMGVENVFDAFRSRK